MVRAAFSLSLLVSLLALAGLWTMEDPQPWVSSAPSSAEAPARTAPPDARAAVRVGGVRSAQ